MAKEYKNPYTKSDKISYQEAEFLSAKLNNDDVYDLKMKIFGTKGESRYININKKQQKDIYNILRNDKSESTGDRFVFQNK